MAKYTLPIPFSFLRFARSGIEDFHQSMTSCLSFMPQGRVLSSVVQVKRPYQQSSSFHRSRHSTRERRLSRVPLSFSATRHRGRRDQVLGRHHKRALNMAASTPPDTLISDSLFKLRPSHLQISRHNTHIREAAHRSTSFNHASRHLGQHQSAYREQSCQADSRNSSS